jgi:beta-lactamase regulating signal transducer with metallopeptidase domain
MQALSLAVYGCRPLLRLISERLDMDREMACDERASIQSGSAIDYANALFASTRSALLHAWSSRTLAIGIFESRAVLTRRMEAPRSSMPRAPVTWRRSSTLSNRVQT